jgi:hypothetical protein
MPSRAINSSRIVGQRLIDLVDLQDRTAEVVAVLLVATADRLGVVERQTDLVLPERQRRRRVVGGKADVDARFREVHRGFQWTRGAVNSGRRYVTQLCATTMRGQAGFEDCLAFAHPVPWRQANPKNNKSGEKTPWHA